MCTYTNQYHDYQKKKKMKKKNNRKKKFFSPNEINFFFLFLTYILNKRTMNYPVHCWILMKILDKKLIIIKKEV